MSVRVIQAGRKLGSRVAVIEVSGVPSHVVRERMAPYHVEGSIVRASLGYGRDLSVSDWTQWAQVRLCM